MGFWAGAASLAGAMADLGEVGGASWILGRATGVVGTSWDEVRSCIEVWGRVAVWEFCSGGWIKVGSPLIVPPQVALVVEHTFKLCLARRAS